MNDGLGYAPKQQPIEVLLIEDNPGDVLLIRRALAQEAVPVRVRVAVDGEQAVWLLVNPRGRFDLIILDLNLPKVSGLEVLERCRPDAPVVVFTSSASVVDRMRSLELGAREFVQKPSDFDGYRFTISQMVHNWASPGSG